MLTRFFQPKTLSNWVAIIGVIFFEWTVGSVFFFYWVESQIILAIVVVGVFFIREENSKNNTMYAIDTFSDKLTVSLITLFYYGAYGLLNLGFVLVLSSDAKLDPLQTIVSALFILVSYLLFLSKDLSLFSDKILELSTLLKTRLDSLVMTIGLLFVLLFLTGVWLELIPFDELIAANPVASRVMYAIPLLVLLYSKNYVEEKYLKEKAEQKTVQRFKKTL